MFAYWSDLGTGRRSPDSRSRPQPGHSSPSKSNQKLWAPECGFSCYEFMHLFMHEGA